MLPRRPALLALTLSGLLGAGVGAPACRRGGPFDGEPPERRAELVARLAAGSDPADARLLLLAEADPSPLVRKAAAGTYAARGGAPALPALGRLVADPDAEVATAAARALSALPADDRVRGLLIQAYPKVASEARAEVATALEAVGGSLRDAVALEARQAWERNVRALEDARGTAAERAGAAEELGRSGRAEAVRLLLPLLEPERREDPRVVAAAARGLGATLDPAARGALETLLEESQDPALAEAAAEALGVLGQAGAADALARVGARAPARLAAVAVEALAALPQAPAVGVALCSVAMAAHDPAVAARAAAQAQAREGECPYRPLVARAGRRGSDAVAALAALEQLRLTPDAAAQAAAQVERALEAPDAGLRAAAARALGRLGESRALPALTRRAAAAADRLARARQQPAGAPEAEEAAAELGALLVARARLHAPDAAALASVRLHDPSPALRAGAVEALAWLGQEQRALLEPALADPDERVWSAAAEALGRIGPQAVTALDAAAGRTRPDDAPRCAALARALGATGAPSAVAGLAGLAAGACPGLAAAALGRIGTTEATARLRALLDGPRLLGRAEVLDALGGLPESGAGPAAAVEVTSDRAEVRAAAARTLGKLRHEPGAARLEALRADYDGQVRRAAVEALSRLPGGHARR